MKQKAILSFILIFSALLSACAGGDTADTTAQTTAAETTTDAVSETESEYTSPGVDYEGAVFTILDYDTDEYFWQAATYSDINAEEENGDPINDAQYKRNMAVEEELNITLETYPVGGVSRFDNANELRRLILAGEDIVDAAFVFGREISNVLSEPGYLMNFNDISTMNLDASWWDQNAIETLTFGSNLKAVTGDISLYTQFAPMLYFYNKNLAEQFGIDDCYDLVRQGEWTFDKVNEYCQLVSNDLDGNSVMDENDRYGIASQRPLLSDMLIASGVSYTSRDSEGGIELSLNNELTVNLVERFVPFLNNGDINNIADLYNNKYSNPFYEMQLPMFTNNQILFNFNQILISFELRAMEADYGILPLPKYNVEQEDYITPMSMSWTTMLVIPATNSRLEETGVVLDCLGYYSQQMVTPEFIDTTIRHKSLRDEDSAEMLEIVLDKKVYDIAQIYNFGGIIDTVNKLATSNSTNFASVYQSVESAVKTQIEKTLELIAE